MNEVQWELSQEFHFELNADDVVTYILGSSEWKQDRMFTRVVEIRDGQFIMRLFLGVTSGVRAIYSIGLVGGTCAGIDFYDEKRIPLLSPTTDIGEIAIIQVKSGECLAKLYLETNPRHLGSDHTSLWHVTPRLAAIFWKEIINGWTPNVTAISETSKLGSGYSQINLGNIIEEAFNLEELCSLCYELKINPENIAGTTLRAKVRELVHYADRRGLINELIKLCRKQRPNANWELIFIDKI
jgi:hypothetical protein